ncbi:non-SMC mitotic condensation complex subunit 1-domain-containing protein [Auriculariales sp. MPI-PUGE-AT-0066]|nr:non-SMC mitotic condensation complex subunit 1-domain-containing protein [Auriculariales sp. MPI-PUGE-AT-0066]
MTPAGAIPIAFCPLSSASPMAPFELQAEMQALQDLDTYHIANEHEVDGNDHGAVSGLLSGAVEAVETSPEAITEPEVFDVYRSLLKHSAELQGSTMNQLLDSLSSGLKAELDVTLPDIRNDDPDTFMAHKQPLEMFSFLLHWFVIAAEKVTAKGDEEGAGAAVGKPARGRSKAATTGRGAASRKSAPWSWAQHIPSILQLLVKVLQIPTHRLWTTTAERDAFINCITRPAYHISESKEYVKNAEIKAGVYEVICIAAKNHGHAFAAQISILQCVQYYEHLAEPMAECLTRLVQKYDHTQLAEEILREIANRTFSAIDPKTPRNISRFMVALTQALPGLVLRQASLLLTHLDSESYPMRLAVVEMLGELIRDISQSEEGDQEKRQKKIHGLFELLGERFLDNSAFVRVRVMQVASKICDLPSKFPTERLKLTLLAIESLEDKNSTVRRAAIALLTKLVLTHPYGRMHGGELALTKWEDRYAEMAAKVREAEGHSELEKPPVVRDDVSQDGEATEPEDESEATPRKVKNEDESSDAEDQSMAIDEDGNADGTPRPRRIPLKKRKSDVYDVSALNDEQQATELLQGQQAMSFKLRKRYCAEAVEFIKQIESAMLFVADLLGSKAKSEVLEAIEFFRITHEYEMEGAEAGLKRMLHLVWVKDNAAVDEDGKELKGIKARLIECYRALYFDAVPDMEPKQQVNRITKNMIECVKYNLPPRTLTPKLRMTYNTDMAGLTSLEELLRTMMDDDQIHGDVIGKLWAVYSSPKKLPREQRRGAITILGMLALARRSIVQDKVDKLLKIGLGREGKEDPVLARYTCIALQRLSGSAKKVKGSLIDKSTRFPMDSVIFRERPDLLCDTIIKGFTRRVFGQQAEGLQGRSTPIPPQGNQQQDVSMDEAGSETVIDKTLDESLTGADATALSADLTQSSDRGDSFVLSQLLFIVGHVAIKQIVFLELVEREWKRQKEVGKATAEGGKPDSAIAKDELEQVAGNAEDEIGDRVAAIRETELLYGEHSLLAKFGPMLVTICGKQTAYKNPILRAAAVLAFSKFLCVSSHYCDKHHMLLFTLLKKTKDPNIRSNIVIALGDLAVSFGSVIDESNAELYRGLSDSNRRVKKNTLMVLTHLILNGMIKIKGQLGEMAKCLEDPDQRIADLAKLFFTELSTKDNAIYNNLPDVISHLSTGEHAVDEEAFQSTMKYIFTFIEKEKQAESIVEKLCQRMRLATEERQWRDIAFCLSLLPFKSDRSIKKLIEGLSHYRDKLHEPKVFEYFSEILAKARQRQSKAVGASKPEAELNEFESILQEAKEQGEEDLALEKRAETKKAAAKKRASRRTTRPR